MVCQAPPPPQACRPHTVGFFVPLLHASTRRLHHQAEGAWEASRFRVLVHALQTTQQLAVADGRSLPPGEAHLLQSLHGKPCHAGRLHPCVSARGILQSFLGHQQASCKASTSCASTRGALHLRRRRIRALRMRVPAQTALAPGARAASLLSLQPQAPRHPLPTKMRCQLLPLWRATLSDYGADSCGTPSPASMLTMPLPCCASLATCSGHVKGPLRHAMQFALTYIVQASAQSREAERAWNCGSAPTHAAPPCRSAAAPEIRAAGALRPLLPRELGRTPGDPTRSRRCCYPRRTFETRHADRPSLMHLSTPAFCSGHLKGSSRSPGPPSSPTCGAPAEEPSPGPRATQPTSCVPCSMTLRHRSPPRCRRAPRSRRVAGPSILSTRPSAHYRLEQVFGASSSATFSGGLVARTLAQQFAPAFEAAAHPHQCRLRSTRAFLASRLRR